MNHEQTTALYNMLMILTEDEEHTTQKAAPQPEPEPEPQPLISVYQANDTMRLLGYQYIPDFAENYIEDIVKAYGLQDSFYNNDFQLFSLIIDVFNYGMIEGKRTLRQRKKATAKPTK